MPPQGANGSRGRNGADIDDQSDRNDQIEAAVRWIQARQALFKRIAASHARTDRLRARKGGNSKNGKMRAPRDGSLAEGPRRRT
jgi:hypothetical protein